MITDLFHSACDNQSAEASKEERLICHIFNSQQWHPKKKDRGVESELADQHMLLHSKHGPQDPEHCYKGAIASEKTVVPDEASWASHETHIQGQHRCGGAETTKPMER